MSRRHLVAHVREQGKYATAPGSFCVACDQPATHWVRIAETYMRGEDEIVTACQRHSDMARDAFSKFCAHIRTKDRFLESRTTLADTSDRQRNPGTNPEPAPLPIQMEE